MCRIYGYAGTGFDRSAMSNARNAQMQGGPDAQQVLAGQGWALGCNRLAIQDPATGQQPFSNANGTVFAVFNGEIYNFRSIRDELSRCGIQVEGDSDGSVLIPFYELLGDRFVDRLEGMFAIAIMDLRRGCTLKLFCDSLAIKNLHYAITKRGVAFASELRALREIVGSEGGVDPSAIDEYLTMQCIPPGSSWLKGMTALRPGEGLRHDHHQGTTQRLEARSLPSRPASIDDPSLDQRAGPNYLRNVLDAEIDRMTLQSAPIAVQISGGLDSAVLARLLAERRSDVTGFHVTHEGVHQSDELQYAQDAARHAEIPLRVVEVREARLPDLLRSVVRVLGAPNATPHAISAYVLFQAISHNGFRVCFSGDGADEQFGGYRRYATAMSAPANTWAAKYLDRLSLLDHVSLKGLYTDDYLAFLQTVGDSRSRHLKAFSAHAGSRLARMLSFDLEFKLPGLNLSKLDHLSMAHSVECRVPYCQIAVTRFARTLPDEFKIAGPERKRVLYDVADSLAPPSVRTRAKQPFTFPTAAFMRPNHAFWDFTRDVLATSALCKSGFIRRDALNALITDHEKGADRSRVLWGLLVLELSLSAEVPAD